MSSLQTFPFSFTIVHSVLLQSYLSHITFRVSVDLSYSTVGPVAAGVPQESVVVPVLNTNDLPVLPGVTLYLFADDAM